MKVPSFTHMKKPILFIFGLVMATFEIVVRFGQDPYVFLFLFMCLGFIPAKSADEIIRKGGGLFAVSKDLLHEEDEPAKEAAP